MLLGGKLGLYCVHEYAHTNKRFINCLPYALKGLDPIVFSILLRDFGFKVLLRPVLQDIVDEVDSNDSDDDSEPPVVGDRVGTALHPLLLSHESTGVDQSRAEVYNLLSTRSQC